MTDEVKDKSWWDKTKDVVSNNRVAAGAVAGAGAGFAFGGIGAVPGALAGAAFGWLSYKDKEAKK